MKRKVFFLIGAFSLLVTGCENGTASSDKVPEPAVIVKHTTQPSEGTPLIFMPEKSYEFPSVVEGIEVTHDFIIRNKGKGDLEINRVKTS